MCTLLTCENIDVKVVAESNKRHELH